MSKDRKYREKLKGDPERHEAQKAKDRSRKRNQRNKNRTKTDGELEAVQGLLILDGQPALPSSSSTSSRSTLTSTLPPQPQAFPSVKMELYPDEVTMTSDRDSDAVPVGHLTDEEARLREWASSLNIKEAELEEKLRDVQAREAAIREHNERTADLRADPTSFDLDVSLAQIVVLVLTAITILGSLGLAMIFNNSRVVKGTSNECDDNVGLNTSSFQERVKGHMPDRSWQHRMRAKWMPHRMTRSALRPPHRTDRPHKLDAGPSTEPPSTDFTFKTPIPSSSALSGRAGRSEYEVSGPKPFSAPTSGPIPPEQDLDIKMAGVNIKTESYPSSICTLSDDSDDIDVGTLGPTSSTPEAVYKAMARDQHCKDQLADILLYGAATESLGNDVFLLEISKLRLEVSNWSSSWGGVDKFANYAQLAFYRAVAKDDVLSGSDDEVKEGPPPFSVGHFFSRWCGDMNEKVQEGELLLLRAKHIGGGMVSWVSGGGVDGTLLTMSWWKYQFLWTESISIVQELVRGMGKIDATCQLLLNHPNSDFRPSFAWRPPYSDSYVAPSH